MACGEGKTNCDEACVDTKTNPAHCGGCGMSCAASEVCVAGKCTTGIVTTLLSGYNANLRGYWKFDGDTIDSSGAGIDATAHGGVSFVAGKHGSAASFDGAAAFLDFANAVVDSPVNMSIVAWVKPTGAADGAIFGFGAKGGCNPSTVYFSRMGTGALRSMVGCADGEAMDAGSIPTDVWTHVAITRDSMKRATLYVNGAPVAGPLDNTGGNTMGTGNDTVGVAWGGGGKLAYFKGQIDELAIWTGVTLSSADVAKLHEESK